MTDQHLNQVDDFFYRKIKLIRNEYWELYTHDIYNLKGNEDHSKIFSCLFPVEKYSLHRSAYFFKMYINQTKKTQS